MDGVILDSERLYDLTDTELLRRRNIVYDRKRVIRQVTGRSFPECTKLIMDAFAVPGDVDAIMNERRAILYQIYASSLEFMTGFLDFHALLKTKGVPSCIATSSEDRILDFIEQKMRLSKLFGNNIFKISDVGHKSKPDPAIFLHAAEKMNATPATCTVIEDAPNGIRAAKKAGMYCVAFATTHRRDELGEADVVVNAFPEIAAHLFGASS